MIKELSSDQKVDIELALTNKQLTIYYLRRNSTMIKCFLFFLSIYINLAK